MAKKRPTGMRQALFTSVSSTRDRVVAAMAEVRKLGDTLEMVADDLWPLPTDREMLFFE